MYKELNEQDETIRTEADILLNENRLLAILSKYGKTHIHGSYQLKLMTWRDLDIYLNNKDLAISDFFEMGKEIAIQFNPIKMSYKNNRDGIFKEEPKGLYWGTKFNNQNGARRS